MNYMSAEELRDARYGYFKHFQQRAKDRYGLYVTWRMHQVICKVIREFDTEHMKAIHHIHHEVFLIKYSYNNTVLTLVYDNSLDCIRTALPARSIKSFIRRYKKKRKQLARAAASSRALTKRKWR